VRRSTINYLVDLLLLLAMLGMLWTGVVIRFVLPAGSGRHALLLWGKGRHEWGDVHYQLVFVTIGLVVLHVGLHWDWVCDVTGRLFVRGERKAEKRRPGLRIACGVAFLAGVSALFGLGVWTALLRVDELAKTSSPGYHGNRPDRVTLDDHDTPGDHEEGDAGHGKGAGQGWGSQTLAEIEKQYGIPVAVLLKRLRVPETVSAETRLARLRQEYGISMSTVRDVIHQYLEQMERAPAVDKP